MAGGRDCADWIGLTNLTVSFSLALIIALRARQVSFAQWRLLISNLSKRLVSHPHEIFLPSGEPSELKHDDKN